MSKLQTLAALWKVTRALGFWNSLKVINQIKKILKEVRRMKKGWFTSKTVWFGVLNVVVSVAGMFSPTVKEFLGAHVVEIQAIIGSIVVMLRAVTKGPVDAPK